MKTIRTVSAAYRKRQQEPVTPDTSPRCPSCNLPCVGLCLKCASPGQILRIRFVLAETMASPPSTTGTALEVGQNGHAQVTAFGRSPSSMRRWADVLHLCRGLTAEEEQVCRLRYTLIAGLVKYEREIAAHDLGVAMEREGEERSGPIEGGRCKVTGTKAVWASWGQIAGRLNTLTATINPDWSARMELPQTPLSPRQCQSRYESASAKVAQAQRTLDVEKWRAMMRMLEEAAG